MAALPRQRWHERLTPAAAGHRARSHYVADLSSGDPADTCIVRAGQNTALKTERPNDWAGEGDSGGRVASTGRWPLSPRPRKFPSLASAPAGRVVGFWTLCETFKHTIRIHCLTAARHPRRPHPAPSLGQRGDPVTAGDLPHRVQL